MQHNNDQALASDFGGTCGKGMQRVCGWEGKTEGEEEHGTGVKGWQGIEGEWKGRYSQQCLREIDSAATHLEILNAHENHAQVAFFFAPRSPGYR